MHTDDLEQQEGGAPEPGSPEYRQARFEEWMQQRDRAAADAAEPPGDR